MIVILVEKTWPKAPCRIILFQFGLITSRFAHGKDRSPLWLFDLLLGGFQWSGAGVGVGLLKGREISSWFVVFLVSWFLGFSVV